MAPYFILFIILIILALSDKKKPSRGIRIFAYILLAFFSGFRYHVGVDYESYVSTFHGDSGFTVNEPAFRLWVDVLNDLGFSFQMMFLGMSAVTAIFVYKALSRLEKGFWISTIVYFCVSTFYLASFNGCRQYVAIAIVLWALKYVYEKKIYSYMVSIIVTALCFHTSVLIFIPLYFFLNRVYSRIDVLIQLVCVISLAKFLNFIILYTPYIKYLVIERELPINVSVYLFAAVSFYFALFSKRYRILQKDSVLVNMNLLCLYSLILVVLQSSGMLVQMVLRINSYFLFGYLQILPSVLYSIRPKYRNVSMIVLFFFCAAYLIRTICFAGEQFMLVPYDMNFNLFK